MPGTACCSGWPGIRSDIATSNTGKLAAERAENAAKIREASAKKAQERLDAEAKAAEEAAAEAKARAEAARGGATSQSPDESEDKA